MREIKIEDLKFNPITAFRDDWVLVSAGNKDAYNTMTISWGHLGLLWSKRPKNRYVASCYIRPQRYTKEFMDKEDYFTLSFFEKKDHKELAYLGSHSGRDEDKVSKVGYKASFENNYTYFDNAKMVIFCRKIYNDRFNPELVKDPAIFSETYPLKDYHYLYIGEIEKIYIRD